MAPSLRIRRNPGSTSSTRPLNSRTASQSLGPVAQAPNPIFPPSSPSPASVTDNEEPFFKVRESAEYHNEPENLDEHEVPVLGVALTPGEGGGGRQDSLRVPSFRQEERAGRPRQGSMASQGERTGKGLLPPPSSTATRPRARSKTITSIFESSPYPSSPISPSSPGGNVPFDNNSNTGARRPSNAASSTMGRRGRVTSISSGGDGVPLQVVIPGTRTSSEGVGGSVGRRRAGTVSSVVGQGGAAGSRERALLPKGEQSVVKVRSGGEQHPAEMEEHHHDSVVDHLDVIDPTISVFSHLQKISQAIMLPASLSPRPVLALPDQPLPAPMRFEDEDPNDTDLIDTSPSSNAGLISDHPANRARSSTLQSRTSRVRRASNASNAFQAPPRAGTIMSNRRGSVARSNRSNRSHYSEIHDDPLDQHVAECLSKRQQAKKAWLGVWAFLKTPMGILVGFYGFNVVFWGAAIVFFLAKIINLKNKYKQDLWVEITSQIVNALFTITGVGLMPYRLIDTYRVFIIWRLKRLTTKLRKERGLPPIENPNDLPDPLLDPDFIPVLSEKQQAQLRHQQEKFSQSQTWYRPHATETHYAFPISLALWNTLLMDLNSLFQVILCVCMWTLSTYSTNGRITLRMGTLHTRPPWTTGCLIPLGFLCGIGAGVIIWKGGQRTKKVAQVEDKLRSALGVVEEEIDPSAGLERAEEKVASDGERGMEMGEKTKAVPLSSQGNGPTSRGERGSLKEGVEGEGPSSSDVRLGRESV